MQCTEKETTSDEIETPNSNNQETPEEIQEFRGLEEELVENCSDKDLNLKSIIDVSSKRLDFSPINNVVEDDDETRENVEEFYMYKNELNLIPRVVGSLKGLKTLKFFSNEINLFPGEFRNLVDLECLQVKVMAPGVSGGGLEWSKFRNLRELELSRVPPKPSAFPVLSEIAGLKCLTRLSVCHFSIRYLPPEIGCLNNLEHLDLSFNKMRNLPDEISSLNALISLKIANNKLIELPLGLSNLERLENMDLSNNRLSSLGCLELESMHNLQSLNLQHNRLSGCQIPSWICCNLEGNIMDLSNDESAEMDVYEGVTQEIHSSPCSSVAPRSHSSGMLPKNQRLAERRTKGWKRRHNLPSKAQQERLNTCKKWKVDATSRSSSEKCTTCRLSIHNDDAASESLSVVEDAEIDNEDLLTEGDVHQKSIDCPENEDLSADKESVECSCSPIDSDTMRKEVEADDSESNIISTSLSDAVQMPHECLSSEASNCVLKPKRQSDKDLDNPKPTKSRRPINDPSYLSCRYSEISFCGVGDYLPDGFYDAGRDRPFMPLDSYEKNLHVNTREVILLDRERDEELDAILLRARSLVRQFQRMNNSADEDRDIAIDNFQIASLLALFVSDHFGGSDKSSGIKRTRKAASGSKYGKPFVCTCATGVTCDTSRASEQNVQTEDIAFLDVCEKSIVSKKERYKSNVVPIGALQFGVCRHRALLMKYLCDRMEPRIPCELVRGYLDFTPHAWNVIIIKKGESSVRMTVDACHPHDIREESDPEYFCRYIPLSRVSAPLVADHGASPICSFPSLSACREIGKVASTSLMRCNIGSLEAAVKMRTVESGASAEKVKNLEFSCLGEVRILSALNHSCIVEFYGHQILSKWSLTVDGNSGGRTLQSAILMEYIKGGSLQSYVEKLSISGEKHVAPELALSIARDVAFALTELHGKHIIHRDIKSSNILIDLDKKRQDGTPIVKICDFDMAIPLHSYMHTCCIRHVGIPAPDICVGTPRWMAPEVFHAMNEHKVYGLEVDIWSFGCVLLELLTLQIPYSGIAESEIHNPLQMGERPRLTEELEELAQSDEELDTKSETLRFLVKLYHQCTEKNPADRPSAENIYSLLLARIESTVTSSRSSEHE